MARQHDRKKLARRDARTNDPQRLHLHTTLRRRQTNGVDFTLHDKVAIAGMLDELGIDYVEGGYPGANPIDTELFGQSRDLKTKLTAFGMTRRPGRSASNDPGLRALIDAKADAICFVAKSWDYQVRVALECTLEENLASIRDSIRAAKAAGREVLLDCEHFFDGYKANPQYALANAQAAYEEGARWVVLCDTNGGTRAAGGRRHRGRGGQACAGRSCRHPPTMTPSRRSPTRSPPCLRGRAPDQGTERARERCGSYRLHPDPQAQAQFATSSTSASPTKLATLTHVSRQLDEMLNRAPDRHAPYVGASAFATKAGIHASAILKEPATYEHVAPDAVGNARKLMVSDQAGKSNVLFELERIGIKADRDDPRIAVLLEEVKQREAVGYAYEAAEASFELLARRMLGKVPDYFEVTQFDVNVEQRINAKGERITVSMAVVKVRVDGKDLISAGEGNGPVNALDVALRKDIGKYQSYIEGLELTDYRVRILNGGTEAVTRVLIESQDESGERWTTVGVSPNIIDASFQALMDSIIYKLVKSGATV